MITASGILFHTPEKKALFLKRGPGGDYPGYWCFPGGKQEDDETIKACALREAKEELGSLPKGMSEPEYWTRSNSIAAGFAPAPVAPVGEQPIAEVLPGAAVAGEKVDFTTFISEVAEEFNPKVDGEHVGYAWAPLDQPPQPLHPGADVALNRFVMDERGVAQAIADGRLTSPQKYDNVWLFAIRITGTGVAYRRSWDEFVWRAPELYMNQEFLDRCLGLPVIMEHPDKSVLDTKEFADRIVGTVVLPYLVPEKNEVWAVAKIYDEPTATLMTEKQLSTSPAVVFRDPEVNNELELANGKKLLVEGKPSLLDHIAICEQGVWDKGGAPSGVQSANIGETIMADEEKRAAEDKARKDAEDRAKADADAGEKLDKILTGLDSICKRMDAHEARMDSVEEEMKADKKRKDDDDDAKSKKDDDDDDDAKKGSEEDEKEKSKADDDDAKKDDDDDDEKKKDSEPGEGADKPKELAADKKKRKDSARKDSDGFDVKKEIQRVESLIPKALSDEDYKSFADAQERADHIFSAFGDSAPRPLQGESLLSYRKRMVGKLKTYSDSWKNTDVSKIADDNAFKVIEDQVFADAVKAASKAPDLPKGHFREMVRTDATGRRITTFAGTSSFVQQFKQPTRRVQRLNTNFERH